MNFRIIVIFVFISAVSFAATEKKNINKSFNVDIGQDIEINSVSGVNVNVRSWDKDEIKFELRVSMNSSDEEYEQEYVDEFNIRAREEGSILVIDLIETDESVSWSVWDIFKLKFGVTVDKDINGEIFVPNANAVKMNIRYSDIKLSGMQNELSIIGRGNDINLAGCDSVTRIDNLYGDIKLENCGGNLDIESRGSEINIRGFRGNAEIDALYSSIIAEDISGNLTVVSRSEDIRISNIGVSLDVNADYSDIDIKNVTGLTNVSDRGGTININNTGGLYAMGPYSEIHAENILGTAADTIIIENRSGVINLIKSTGVVVINDEYSDMNLREINGSVNINARSNSITAFDINGDWLSLSQYSSIDIRKLNADRVKIHNRSGAVSVTLQKLPSAIEINNVYDEVDVSVAAEISGDITLDAKYGEIETDLPLRFRRDGDSSFAYGIIGNSNSIINIITRSGDIKFKEF